MPLPVLFALVTVSLMALAGYFGYDYGQSSKEAEYAEQQRAAAAVLADLATRNRELDQRILAATQAIDAQRSQVITRWRTKAVALPDRGCGWTAGERVLLNASYCSAFPDAADCVSAAVPAAPEPPAQPGGSG